MTTKRLYRSASESMIGGVAAGLADYFDIDRTIVRILFIVAFFLPINLPVILTYVILWIAMPKGERYLKAEPHRERG
jgi:phage shock protein C